MLPQPGAAVKRQVFPGHGAARILLLSVPHMNGGKILPSFQRGSESMEISGAYSANGLWDLDPVSAVNGEKASGGARPGSGSGSGDTAEISDEARRLYSEMIHKYDRPASGGTAQDSGEDAGAGGGASGEGAPSGGGAGGASSSSSGNDAESIRKQIQSLKSQLMGMASQLTGGAADAAVTGKMDALQSQIAALEAQLNEMEQAG